jgi:hypothetical protein
LIFFHDIHEQTTLERSSGADFLMLNIATVIMYIWTMILKEVFFFLFFFHFLYFSDLFLICLS